MPSTTATAAWSVGVCSPARRLPVWKRCALGPGCAPCWRWKPSAGSTAPATVEAEIRYGLSSCGDDPKVLIQAIRRHWTIDNGLHGVLDVTFREDDSRVRDRTAARNLASFRPKTLRVWTACGISAFAQAAADDIR